MKRTDQDPADAGPATSTEGGLYFFPDQVVSEDEVREILRSGSPERRAWVVSHLLRFAQWDDIWNYVDRDEVRAIFDRVEMPDKLRAAWARMLKIEAPVS
ncbi:MAG: hypothetical protein D6696_18985 [Acidobacteria bacterium]|nr:MAG: hypothetical protein D6696_18985 [Acidobacteriota bacterium]